MVGEGGSGGEARSDSADIHNVASWWWTAQQLQQQTTIGFKPSMGSTCRPLDIMRFTALPPPPPTPMTLMRASPPAGRGGPSAGGASIDGDRSKHTSQRLPLMHTTCHLLGPRCRCLEAERDHEQHMSVSLNLTDGTKAGRASRTRQNEALSGGP